MCPGSGTYFSIGLFGDGVAVRECLQSVVIAACRQARRHGSLSVRDRASARKRGPTGYSLPVVLVGKYFLTGYKKGYKMKQVERMVSKICL